ncbi:hypothetical protein GCM10011363_39540 [Marivita lacus]|jgi:hypothetical protein|uniref:Secreted protein n=1 Tax=Marivita lacus TaxID=1323742 RepID=A0ABQ1L3E5_9RHOB|nr:hypothetical protein [Marivita lacus]GGC18946.1 hypothetical protein GCM10011363_39540 [Marivita lacus]
MLRKIPFDTSLPVLERFVLSEEAGEVILADMSPELALQTLHEKALFVDLVHYFAHGMPPREGVCWALAVQGDLLRAPSAPDQALRALVTQWVRDPQEGTRVALMQAAEDRGHEDPLGWLCNAVAWNGSGSIGPIKGPVVLPPSGLHASGLLGAISLLAGETEDSLAAAGQATFDRGMEVARGGWPGVLG